MRAEEKLRLESHKQTELSKHRSDTSATEALWLPGQRPALVRTPSGDQEEEFGGQEAHQENQSNTVLYVQLCEEGGLSIYGSQNLERVDGIIFMLQQKDSKHTEVITADTHQ